MGEFLSLDFQNQSLKAFLKGVTYPFLISWKKILYGFLNESMKAFLRKLMETFLEEFLEKLLEDPHDEILEGFQKQSLENVLKGHGNEIR